MFSIDHFAQTNMELRNVDHIKSPNRHCNNMSPNWIEARTFVLKVLSMANWPHTWFILVTPNEYRFGVVFFLSFLVIYLSYSRFVCAVVRCSIANATLPCDKREEDCNLVWSKNICCCWKWRSHLWAACVHAIAIPTNVNINYGNVKSLLNCTKIASN